jgi:hypothetical protein
MAGAVARWFGRFPAWTESREDAYLLDPQLRGLSVKVRGARICPGISPAARLAAPRRAGREARERAGCGS